MSLYGALFSGVSGLSAQSSAMGAISDNISNVNTIGYKGTQVAFSTLVTHQTSQTNYSPGGVQSKPRTGVDVQGLLQATNSSTDVSLSGSGFFIVNEAAKPLNGDQFAYTRAGSFSVDEEGYLTNTSGWYMQGWPLANWDQNQQASVVEIGNTTFMKSYKDDAGSTVYINDNIVNSDNLQPLNLNDISGTAAQTRNIRMGANLPNDADVGFIAKQPLTIYDSLGGDGTVQFSWKKVSQNNWDLEAIPPTGAKSLTLKNQTAAGNSGNVYGSMGRLDFRGLPQTVDASGNAAVMTMSINGTAYTFQTATSGGDGTTLHTFTTDPTGQSTSTYVNDLADDVNLAFNLEYNSLYMDGSSYANGDTLGLTVNGTGYTFTSLGADANAAAGTLNSTTAFTDLGLKAAVDGTRLYIYSENAMSYSIDTTTSTGSFAGAWMDLGSASTTAGTNDVGSAATSKTTNGIVYCEQLAGTTALVFRQYDNADDIVLAGLDTIDLSDGSPATLQGQDLVNSDTFTLQAASEATNSAIAFNGDGTPGDVNVHFVEIDWANGSEDMDGTDEIGLFLGNEDVSDGMTQLNGDYQLTYSSQDGAKFGNFSGVTIDTDGVVTALFDNGVTRPVFQIPVATFVNPNGMSSLSGNVFIATDFSGDPTLRQAGSAGAGQVNGSALESSTVDIGTEFTTMIVTQRAYSAAAKIITTADEMLDDLINIKR